MNADVAKRLDSRGGATVEALRRQRPTAKQIAIEVGVSAATVILAFAHGRLENMYGDAP